MNRKTALYVWLMERRIVKVETAYLMTGADTARVQVIFTDEDGSKKTIGEWTDVAGIRRGEFDSTMELRFTPGYDGLFGHLRDREAEDVIKRRTEKADLVEKREELKAELRLVDEELGGPV